MVVQTQHGRIQLAYQRAVMVPVCSPLFFIPLNEAEMLPSVPDGISYASQNVLPLTWCADGSICCGKFDIDDSSVNCCNSKQGFMLKDNTFASQPLSSTSTAPSNTPSATETASQMRSNTPFPDVQSSSIPVLQIQSSNSVPAQTSPASKPAARTHDTGAIIGGAVSGAVAVSTVGIVLYFTLRRKRKNMTRSPSQTLAFDAQPIGGSQELTMQESRHGLSEFHSRPFQRSELPLGVRRGREMPVNENVIHELDASDTTTPTIELASPDL